MKRNLLTLMIGAVLVLIFALLLFSFQVRKSEIAVVTTFGKPTRPVVKPGAYFKWPWPIQNVYKFDERIQNFEDKFTEDLTKDNTTLLTMVYVGWRINDPKAFFPKFAGDKVAEAQKILEDMLRSAKSAVVGKHPFADFVNANEKDLKFDEIETEIKAIVQSQLEANNYGIQIEFLGIKRLGLPESVTQAVFERMTSERQVLISKSQYEGEAEAQKIRSARRPQGGRNAGQCRRRKPRESAVWAKRRRQNRCRCSSRIPNWPIFFSASMRWSNRSRIVPR